MTGPQRTDDYEWTLERTDPMRVPAVLYGSEEIIAAVEPTVFKQLANTASLPGVVRAVYAMPDTHSGYGFPIGGVAAMDADRGGVVSAGGVGFDIACGVRALTTRLDAGRVLEVQKKLADALYRSVPSGVGGSGRARIGDVDDVLAGGAAWAVSAGYGRERDLAHIEDGGRIPGAQPGHVSDHARKRGADQVGTLGSGNHYLEVQRVADIFDPEAAEAFGLFPGQVIVSIHCGSRGLGHQIATDYGKLMQKNAPKHGLTLPDKQLAAAPIRSGDGEHYLGAMRAAINYAMANRQVITHFVRGVFETFFRAQGALDLVADVSHNTCKVEEHMVQGVSRRLHVHRKGATRALPPGHPALAPEYRDVGQPVLIGGSMGTESWILAGMEGNSERSFSSACHGAGRVLSRSAAKKRWRGRQVVDELASHDIIVRAGSVKGVAEEAPQAYKDAGLVVESTHRAGLARPVARLVPLVCVKG